MTPCDLEIIAHAVITIKGETERHNGTLLLVQFSDSVDHSQSNSILRDLDFIH
jgi:hypothetical protein